MILREMIIVSALLLLHLPLCSKASAIIDAAKMAKKLDCYAGMGFRAGGCGSNDLKNHELRISNLEVAGNENHKHTKAVGGQVNVLKEVAEHHQTLHEWYAKERGGTGLPAVGRARALLNTFPDARASRSDADAAWRRVFRERVLKTMTPIDWLQMLLGAVIVCVVALKTYACVRSRRGTRTDINITASAAPPPPAPNKSQKSAQV